MLCRKCWIASESDEAEERVIAMATKERCDRCGGVLLGSEGDYGYVPTP